jgi:hypothetical protein
MLGSIAILGRTPSAMFSPATRPSCAQGQETDPRFHRRAYRAHGRGPQARGRLDGDVTPEPARHYAIDTPEDLMLICAGSPIGALSMVLPGFGSSKTAGRSPAILVEAPAR